MRRADESPAAPGPFRAAGEGRLASRRGFLTPMAAVRAVGASSTGMPAATSGPNTVTSRISVIGTVGLAEVHLTGLACTAPPTKTG